MVTSQQALKKYGDPELLATQSKCMEVWVVPEDIRSAFAHVRFTATGTFGFPKKIYLNKDMRAPLEQALRNIITKGLASELKTWDGVFIIRSKRGFKTMSLHSWALAFDINQETNRLGATPTLSQKLVKAVTDAGFDWGGSWKRPDGMHFQLSKI